MTRIHLICGKEPNESDPDGDEYFLCGIDGMELNGSRHAAYVDCKKCLKRMNKQSNDEKPHGN